MTPRRSERARVPRNGSITGARRLVPLASCLLPPAPRNTPDPAWKPVAPMEELPAPTARTRPHSCSGSGNVCLFRNVSLQGHDSALRSSLHFSHRSNGFLYNSFAGIHPDPPIPWERIMCTLWRSIAEDRVCRTAYTEEAVQYSGRPACLCSREAQTCCDSTWSEGQLRSTLGYGYI
ncbi:hypothetical protein GQ53DRAFT_747508 [Thozetella sp. PMI_491]|nr:hypothetical protein GQ53DRAFT_747508 [Thozetella sp. PMI_491]